MDASGNLYGATTGGGSDKCQGYGCGVVFELTPTGTEKVLYSFQGGATGRDPQGNLFMDSTGNLFGTTVWAGNRCTGQEFPNKGCGGVFKLTR